MERESLSGSGKHSSDSGRAEMPRKQEDGPIEGRSSRRSTSSTVRDEYLKRSPTRRRRSRGRSSDSSLERDNDSKLGDVLAALCDKLSSVGTYYGELNTPGSSDDLPDRKTKRGRSRKHRERSETPTSSDPDEKPRGQESSGKSARRSPSLTDAKRNDRGYSGRGTRRSPSPNYSERDSRDYSEGRGGRRSQAPRKDYEGQESSGKSARRSPSPTDAKRNDRGYSGRGTRRSPSPNYSERDSRDYSDGRGGRRSQASRKDYDVDNLETLLATMGVGVARTSNLGCTDLLDARGRTTPQVQDEKSIMLNIMNQLLTKEQRVSNYEQSLNFRDHEDLMLRRKEVGRIEREYLGMWRNHMEDRERRVFNQELTLDERKAEFRDIQVGWDKRREERVYKDMEESRKQDAENRDRMDRKELELRRIIDEDRRKGMEDVDRWRKEATDKVDEERKEWHSKEERMKEKMDSEDRRVKDNLMRLEDQTRKRVEALVRSIIDKGDKRIMREEKELAEMRRRGEEGERLERETRESMRRERDKERMEERRDDESRRRERREMDEKEEKRREDYRRSERSRERRWDRVDMERRDKLEKQRLEKEANREATIGKVVDDVVGGLFSVATKLIGRR